MSLPRSPLTKKQRDGCKGDTTAASGSLDADKDDVETHLLLFEKTAIDLGEQEKEPMDSGPGLNVGLGMRGIGVESGADGVRAVEHYDDNENENETTIAGSGRRVASESTSRRAPPYTPQGMMRFRSPRALAESAERWRGKAQGRSTSVAQVAGQYGEFTIEQGLREGAPGAASAPVRMMLNPYAHTAPLGLLEDLPFFPERQERHIERSGSHEARSKTRETRTETTARLPGLPTQLNETLLLGSDVADAASSSRSPDSDLASALSHFSTRRQALEVLMARLSNEKQKENAQHFPSRDALSTTLAASCRVVDRIDDLLARLVSDLLRSEEMKAIDSTAVRNPSITDQSYCETVRELIGTLGCELKKEAEQPMQMGVALALWTRSIKAQAVHALVLRSEALLGGESDAANVDPGQAMTGTTRIDRDGPNCCPSAPLQQLADLSKFLLASKACASFKQRLRRLTHEEYHSRVAKAIGNEVVGPAGFVLPQDALRQLVLEISWLPVRLFDLQDSEIVNLPLLSRLSGFVERRIHQACYWLRGREYHPVREGFSRLLWVLPEGTVRHVDLPWTAIVALQRAFASAPAFLNPSAVTPGVARQAVTVEAKGVKKSNHKTLRPGQSSGTDRPSRFPSTGPDIDKKVSSRLPIQAQEIKTRYLCLCVGLSPSFCFADIDCTHLNDDQDFFDRLKSSYDSTRGPLRRIFSIWQYHHCEFYLLGKWGMGLGGPLEKDYSFPPHLAADVSHAAFAPRLPFLNLPRGLIPPQEFYDRYYRSVDKYWTPPSARPSTDRATASLPLRTEALDWNNGQYETFHGLLAVEQLCYWRLRLYLALLLVLGAVLGWLWAYEWGGRGLEDLQNALTPLLLALAVWQIAAVR